MIEMHDGETAAVVLAHAQVRDPDALRFPAVPWLRAMRAAIKSHRITAAEAMAAIDAHYDAAVRPRQVEVSDVVARVVTARKIDRDWLTQSVEAERNRADESAPALFDIRDAGMAVTCEWCGAEPGVRCRDGAGRELRFMVHPLRLAPTLPLPVTA